MSFHFLIFKYFNHHYRSILMITSFEKSFFSFCYRFLAVVCCGPVHSTNFSFSVLCFHSILFTFAHGSIANMICFWILQILSSWRVGISFAFLMAHEYLIIKLNWRTSIINRHSKALKTMEMKYHEVHCNFFDHLHQRKTTPSTLTNQEPWALENFCLHSHTLCPF